MVIKCSEKLVALLGATFDSSAGSYIW